MPFRSTLKFILPLVTTTLFLSCDHSTQKAPKDVVRRSPAKPAEPSPVAQEPQAVATPEFTQAPVVAIPPETLQEPSVQPPAQAAPAAPASPDCRVVAGFPGEEPVYLPKSKVVLTRLSSPCTTPTGQQGHLPTSGWMVMGFPCTGADGRIDWKGSNYLAPKMVSFLLDTNCPMAPLDQNQLRSSVLSEAGLPATTSMVAFNPFVVQYWEVVGFDDADASFSVELRVGKSLTTGWNAFLKQKPYKVLLVGRENAWVPGNNMYAVDAELLSTAKNRFRLSVLNAHLLKGDELAAIKNRCQALKPERDCGKVF